MELLQDLRVGQLASQERKSSTQVMVCIFFKGVPFVNCILFYPIERLCSRITDVLIAINQEDYFREKSWNTYRVEYVPSIGVDTDVFQNGVIGRLFE